MSGDLRVRPTIQLVAGVNPAPAVARRRVVFSIVGREKISWSADGFSHLRIVAVVVSV